MNLKGISEIFNLPIKIMVALCIASGLILFLSEDYLNRLYLNNFRNEFGFIIGVVFIVTLSIILCNIVSKTVKYFGNKYYLKKLVEIREGSMKKLTEEEKELIKLMDKEFDKTMELPIQSGIIVKLQNADIITPTAKEFLVDFEEPRVKFFLQPWVSIYINEHPDF